ncbi:hypothetical protein GGR51DRAFT_570512 [Nemania sp. FL0031]|nr:hypothetical protein GGR51DRAFT_570512 [Nemania sp. FL0031]
MDLSTRYRLYARGVAVATTNIFLPEPLYLNGPVHGVVPTVIATVLTASLFICAGVVYFYWHKARERNRNRNRAPDVEQGPAGEDIPLQDLPRPPDGALVREPRNPQFSTDNLPDRRPLNDYTLPLSSHPPSQADLTTAQNALEPRNPTQENVPPNTSGPSDLHSSAAAQSNQEQSPQRRGHTSITRSGSTRRHGITFESDNFGTGDASSDDEESTVIRVASVAIITHSQGHVDLPPLTRSAPGIETMPEVLDQMNQEDISNTNDVESPSAEGNVELGNRPLPSPHEHDQNRARGRYDLDSDSDDDHEGNKHNYTTGRAGSSFEGGVQGSRGNWRYSYGDETYDPEDPRYDVVGAVKKYGSTTNRPIDRDWSHPSAVPEPLNLRRNKTIHGTSSPVGTSGTLLPPPPASAAGLYDNLPDGSKIEISNPTSFPIKDWPPKCHPNRAYTHSSKRSSMAIDTSDNDWHKVPPQEVIDASRRAQQELDYKQQAKPLVVEDAVKRGVVYTEEEIDARAHAMWLLRIGESLKQNKGEHSKQDKGKDVKQDKGKAVEQDKGKDAEQDKGELLRQDTYKPPTPPPRARTPQPESRSGRVRANMGHRVGGRLPRPVRPTSGSYNHYPPTNLDDRTVRPEPAFASSQALPLAATMTSITAQDGSRSGSPEPSSPAQSPTRPPRTLRPRSFIPRSHQDPDLSRYFK